jgi:hypothetical protein
MSCKLIFKDVELLKWLSENAQLINKPKAIKTLETNSSNQLPLVIINNKAIIIRSKNELDFLIDPFGIKPDDLKPNIFLAEVEKLKKASDLDKYLPAIC